MQVDLAIDPAGNIWVSTVEKKSRFFSTFLLIPAHLLG
jgi:hypothetical protein